MTTSALSPSDVSPISEPSARSVTVVVEAQLIVANRQAFKQRVLDLLSDGYRAIVVDFRDCGYVDTSGWGALVSVANAAAQQGGEVVLENLHDDLLTLLDLTGLRQAFTIRSSAVPAEVPA